MTDRCIAVNNDGSYSSSCGGSSGSSGGGSSDDSDMVVVVVVVVGYSDSRRAKKLTATRYDTNININNIETNLSVQLLQCHQHRRLHL